MLSGIPFPGEALRDGTETNRFRRPFRTMTHDLPHDGDISSREDFETALRGLVASALENDVDPRGAWEYRTNGEDGDWEVMVVELEPRDG